MRLLSWGARLRSYIGLICRSPRGRRYRSKGQTISFGLEPSLSRFTFSPPLMCSERPWRTSSSCSGLYLHENFSNCGQAGEAQRHSEDSKSLIAAHVDRARVWPRCRRRLAVRRFLFALRFRRVLDDPLDRVQAELVLVDGSNNVEDA